MAVKAVRVKQKNNTLKRYLNHCSSNKIIKYILLFITLFIYSITYSQEVYDDVYYTVDDYKTLDTLESDTLEKSVYITNYYYTNYSSRINRFHRRPYYASY